MVEPSRKETIGKIEKHGKERFRQLVLDSGIIIESEQDERLFDAWWNFQKILLEQWGEPKKISKWLEEHNCECRK